MDIGMGVSCGDNANRLPYMMTGLAIPPVAGWQVN